MTKVLTPMAFSISSFNGMLCHPGRLGESVTMPFSGSMAPAAAMAMPETEEETRSGVLDQVGGRGHQASNDGRRAFLREGGDVFAGEHVAAGGDQGGDDLAAAEVDGQNRFGG